MAVTAISIAAHAAMPGHPTQQRHHYMSAMHYMTAGCFQAPSEAQVYTQGMCMDAQSALRINEWHGYPSLS